MCSYSLFDRLPAKPLVALQSNVVHDALLLAVERFPQPKCHPETRVAAQGVVADWLCRKGPSAKKGIMWLSGAPGVGKSAIVQTVCEALGNKPDNPVHAVHFLGRGQGDREKAFFIPATIADQLCRTTTSSRSVIKKALKNDRTLLRQTLEAQFRKLVIEPAKARWRYLQKPITVVIDALDECNNPADQSQLLQLIFEAVDTNKIRFFIASRPERQIDSFFHREDVVQRTLHIRLDEETFNTSQDIIMFLRAEFARIRQESPQSCPDFPSGEKWPGDVVILKLANDSDAQFIFPKLVIGYIETGVSPHQQLQLLLKALCPGAFSKLDILYYQILSRPPPGLVAGSPEIEQYFKTVKNILQAILAWPKNLSATGIARVLDLEVDVVQGIALGPLRTLFKFKNDDPNSEITFVHKSLRDHLLDASRSRSFFILTGRPDPIYFEIIGRRPPGDRKALIGIMGVLTKLSSRWCPFATVACVLDVDPDVVRSAVCGPTRPLFDVDEKNERFFFFDASVKAFLMDQRRAGVLYIRYGEPPSLFLRILSHPRISAVQREFLMEVLDIVIAWPSGSCTVAVIAAITDVKSGVVRDAIFGPMLPLFDVERERDCVSLFNSSFRSFLLDSKESGEFHVASDNPDHLFLKVLYRQPLYARFDLMGVLRVLVKSQPMTVVEVALASGVTLIDVGLKVIGGPGMRALLDMHEGSRRTVSFSHPSFRAFLVDRARSGAFHIRDVEYSEETDSGTSTLSYGSLGLSQISEVDEEDFVQ